MNSYSSALRRGLFAAAFVLVSLTAASAAESFEGRIHMDMTGGNKKEKMSIEYAMKDGKMRMDPQMGERHDRSGSMGMIVDMQAREMIILMDNDGKKMFMRRPIPQPTAEQTAKVREGHPMSAPVATGRTEMIAGYKATEYRTTNEKGEIIELWLAKGLGPFMSFSGGNPMMGRGTPPPGWENFARAGNAFPMRVVTHDADGTEKMRMEVTSVDKTPLPDSLFSTDGYTEFQMPDLGGMMNPFKR
jgi:hypothetical protein